MFKNIHFQTLFSTHLFAKETLFLYQGQSVFITADTQLHGVGRKKDPWISLGKNLLGSFVFPTPLKHLANVAQILAYSAMHVLETATCYPLFKWPNDLLLSYKKVGGIMAEILGSMAIASIGINVHMKRSQLASIGAPATSLYEELAKKRISLSKIKKALNCQFFSDLTRFRKEGFDPFFPYLAKRLAFVGKRAQAGDLTGTVQRLSKDGRLILQAQGKSFFITDRSLKILHLAQRNIEAF